MAFKNLQDKIAQAVAEGADQTQAKTGGGEATIPAAGVCNLRLVGYIEQGKHTKSFQGKEKKQDLVTLVFELSGRNHPPIETENGKFPHRIEITENLSLNEKARFFKLFRLLNWKGTAKHTAELLGEAFRGKVIHRKYTGKDGKERVAADLFDKTTGAFTISPPKVEVFDADGEPTGEIREVKVDAPISPLRCFLFNYPDMEQWDSLFIEGEYEERKDESGKVVAPARSKNKYQLKIRAALNYTGSPIDQLLSTNGQGLDLPDDGVVEDDDGPTDDETPAEEPKPAAKPAAQAKPKATPKGDPLAGVA